MGGIFSSLGRILGGLGRKIGTFFRNLGDEWLADDYENPMIIPGKAKKVFHRRKDVLGERGEQLAEDFFKQKEWKIVEKNLVLPACEIDLIAWVKGTLVFIEVKTRRTERFSDPFIEVHRGRREKMIRASREYIGWRGYDKATPVRFDILVIILPDNGSSRLNHLQDAFDQKGRPRKEYRRNHKELRDKKPGRNQGYNVRDKNSKSKIRRFNSSQK